MSLRLRLTLAVAVAALAGTAWLAWWIIAHAGPALQQVTEETLADVAMVMAAEVAAHSPGDAPDPAALARAWTDARARPLHARIYATRKEALALEISLTDRHGIVLFDSARPQDVGRDNARWNDVARTLSGAYGARATRADPNDPGTAVLHVAAPVRHGDELIGVVSVSKAVAATTPFVDAQAQTVIAVAAVIAGAVAAMAVAAAAWITTPLARLTAHVRRVAGGARAPLPALGRGEIAELGRALEELREQLEGRKYAEEYVQALTHELKSPLAGIRAAAELLGEDLPASERQRFLANLRGESQRLHELSEELLALAALERRDALASRAPVDLVAVARTVATSATSRLALRGLALAVTGSAAAPATGDAFLLRQALTNLLDNAIAFAPSGSALALDVAAESGCAVITVRDHGPGIPDYALARLFERFFSLPHPATGRKGTGLGLPFVREVARLHGGTVTLENHAQGGAMARLVIPG